MWQLVKKVSAGSLNHFISIVTFRATLFFETVGETRNVKKTKPYCDLTWVTFAVFYKSDLIIK